MPNKQQKKESLLSIVGTAANKAKGLFSRESAPAEKLVQGAEALAQKAQQQAERIRTKKNPSVAQARVLLETQLQYIEQLDVAIAEVFIKISSLSETSEKIALVERNNACVVTLREISKQFHDQVQGFLGVNTTDLDSEVDQDPDDPQALRQLWNQFVLLKEPINMPLTPEVSSSADPQNESGIRPLPVQDLVDFMDRATQARESSNVPPSPPAAAATEVDTANILAELNALLQHTEERTQSEAELAAVAEFEQELRREREQQRQGTAHVATQAVQEDQANSNTEERPASVSESGLTQLAHDLPQEREQQRQETEHAATQTVQEDPANSKRVQLSELRLALQKELDDQDSEFETRDKQKFQDRSQICREILEDLLDQRKSMVILTENLNAIYQDEQAIWNLPKKIKELRQCYGDMQASISRFVKGNDETTRRLIWETFNPSLSQAWRCIGEGEAILIKAPLTVAARPAATVTAEPLPDSSQTATPSTAEVSAAVQALAAPAATIIDTAPSSSQEPTSTVALADKGGVSSEETAIETETKPMGLAELLAQAQAIVGEINSGTPSASAGASSSTDPNDSPFTRLMAVMQQINTAGVDEQELATGKATFVSTLAQMSKQSVTTFIKTALESAVAEAAAINDEASAEVLKDLTASLTQKLAPIGELIDALQDQKPQVLAIINWVGEELKKIGRVNDLLKAHIPLKCMMEIAKAKAQNLADVAKAQDKSSTVMASFQVVENSCAQKFGVAWSTAERPADQQDERSAGVATAFAIFREKTKPGATTPPELTHVTGHWTKPAASSPAPSSSSAPRPKSSARSPSMPASPAAAASAPMHAQVKQAKTDDALPPQQQAVISGGRPRANSFSGWEARPRPTQSYILPTPASPPSQTLPPSASPSAPTTRIPGAMKASWQAGDLTAIETPLVQLAVLLRKILTYPYTLNVTTRDQARVALQELQQDVGDMSRLGLEISRILHQNPSLKTILNERIALTRMLIDRVPATIEPHLAYLKALLQSSPAGVPEDNSLEAALDAVLAGGADTPEQDSSSNQAGNSASASNATTSSATPATGQNAGTGDYPLGWGASWLDDQAARTSQQPPAAGGYHDPLDEFGSFFAEHPLNLEDYRPSDPFHKDPPGPASTGSEQGDGDQDSGLGDGDSHVSEAEVNEPADRPGPQPWSPTRRHGAGRGRIKNAVDPNDLRENIINFIANLAVFNIHNKGEQAGFKDQTSRRAKGLTAELASLQQDGRSLDYFPEPLTQATLHHSKNIQLQLADLCFEISGHFSKLDRVLPTLGQQPAEDLTKTQETLTRLLREHAAIASKLSQYCGFIESEIANLQAQGDVDELPWVTQVQIHAYRNYIQQLRTIDTSVLTGYHEHLKHLLAATESEVQFQQALPNVAMDVVEEEPLHQDSADQFSSPGSGMDDAVEAETAMPFGGNQYGLVNEIYDFIRNVAVFDIQSRARKDHIAGSIARTYAILSSDLANIPAMTRDFSRLPQITEELLTLSGTKQLQLAELYAQVGEHFFTVGSLSASSPSATSLLSTQRALLATQVSLEEQLSAQRADINQQLAVWERIVRGLQANREEPSWVLLALMASYQDYMTRLQGINNELNRCREYILALNAPVQSPPQLKNVTTATAPVRPAPVLPVVGNLPKQPVAAAPTSASKSTTAVTQASPFYGAAAAAATDANPPVRSNAVGGGNKKPVVAAPTSASKSTAAPANVFGGTAAAANANPASNTSGGSTTPANTTPNSSTNAGQSTATPANVFDGAAAAANVNANPASNASGGSTGPANATPNSSTSAASSSAGGSAGGTSSAGSSGFGTGPAVNPASNTAGSAANTVGSTGTATNTAGSTANTVAGSTGPAINTGLATDTFNFRSNTSRAALDQWAQTAGRTYTQNDVVTEPCDTLTSASGDIINIYADRIEPLDPTKFDACMDDMIAGYGAMLARDQLAKPGQPIRPLYLWGDEKAVLAQALATRLSTVGVTDMNIFFLPSRPMSLADWQVNVVSYETWKIQQAAAVQPATVTPATATPATVTPAPAVKTPGTLLSPTPSLRLTSATPSGNDAGAPSTPPSTSPRIK